MTIVFRSYHSVYVCIYVNKILPAHDENFHVVATHRGHKTLMFPSADCTRLISPTPLYFSSIIKNCTMKGLSIHLFMLIGIASVDGFTGRSSHFSRPQSAAAPYPLFQQRSRNHVNEGFPPSLNSENMPIRSTLVRMLRLRALHLFRMFRRSWMMLAVSMLVFTATGLKPQPAHASTAVAPAPTSSKTMSTASLDQIVDRYVRDHMFDDDVYEPVESIYREGIHDKVKGTHPKALSEITSSVLGQDGMKVEKVSSPSNVGDWLMAATSFLQRKGLSESSAIILLTGTLVVAGPIAFLLGLTMVGSQSKRQVKSVLKKRYGDTYT